MLSLHERTSDSTALLDNVRKATIKPFVTKHVAKGTQTYTGEYCIYNSLEEWGYKHKSVCHGKSEYARDDDKDGIYEVQREGRLLTSQKV